MPQVPPTDAYAAALDYLFGRINYERMPSPPYAERHLKLDRMRQLLTRLGNPDAGLPIVHIAGTKGKGSTSALLAGMLSAANYRVGVFSSPHLDRIEERFSMNGRPCAPEELAALVEQIRPVVALIDEEADLAPEAQLRPTFFEITTALALMYFAQQQADLVILEVGLGGRLDSTNVCMPCCTAITSISYDHTKQLGETLAEIAAEKAGIIKPGVPLVMGELEAEPRKVVVEIARSRGARLIAAGVDFQHHYQPPRVVNEGRAGGRLDFQMRPDEHAPQDEGLTLDNAELRLLGGHQARNAAVALALAVELRRQGWLLPVAALRQGLAETTLAGRVEVVSRDPTIVIDVAHNVASAEALVECLKQSFANPKWHLVLAATREKDVAGMLRALLPHFATVTLTEYQENSRAVPVEELAQLCHERWRDGGVSSPEVHVEKQPTAAFQHALAQAGRDDLICITGSFFIAAELRPLLTASEPLRSATSH